MSSSITSPRPTFRRKQSSQPTPCRPPAKHHPFTRLNTTLTSTLGSDATKPFFLENVHDLLFSENGPLSHLRAQECHISTSWSSLYETHYTSLTTSHGQRYARQDLSHSIWNTQGNLVIRIHINLTVSITTLPNVTLFTELLHTSLWAPIRLAAKKKGISYRMKCSIYAIEHRLHQVAN